MVVKLPWIFMKKPKHTIWFIQFPSPYGVMVVKPRYAGINPAKIPLPKEFPSPCGVMVVKRFDYIILWVFAQSFVSVPLRGNGRET